MFSPTSFLTLLAFVVSNVAALGPASVDLATAGNYAVLAQTGVSTVPSSDITGAVAVSPAAATALTGFTLVESATGTFATSAQVTGQLFAASHNAPTPSILTTAISDLGSAYLDAAGRVSPDFTNLFAGSLGGQTLLPGLYKWTTNVGADSDFTISGSPTDTWIFQVDGDLGFAGGKNIILTGGAKASNIVWVVAGAVSIGAGSHYEGVILAKMAVTLITGSSINGRVLAQTSIALQMATVVQPL